jgi:hypothetical protein
MPDFKSHSLKSLMLGVISGRLGEELLVQHSTTRFLQGLPTSFHQIYSPLPIQVQLLAKDTHKVLPFSAS